MRKVTSRYLLPLSLATLLAATTGCSSRQVEFYQLPYEAVDIASQSEGLAVLVGPIKLADYLQREQILQRQPDGRLLYSQQGRWAGGLEEEIGQLLLAQIAVHGNNSQVSLYPDRVGIKPGAQLLVSVSRLDSGAQLPAVLQAQWRLLDVQGKQRASRILSLEQEHDGSLTGQVQAQSQLLQQLAREASQALQDYSRPLLPQAKPARQQPVVEHSPQEQPKAVYRF